MKAIIISNGTGEDVALRIHLDKSSPMNNGKSDTLTMSLGSKGGNSKAAFLRGFGTWSRKDFEQLNESISEIRVITKKDTTVYNRKESLSSILPQKRLGILNNKMKIKLPNNRSAGRQRSAFKSGTTQTLSDSSPLKPNK